MDYSRFRFRAVVDWIELEIVTASATNFFSIQAALRQALAIPDDDSNTWVKALDEGPGRAATVFRFRLQEPARWRDVVAVLDAIAACRPFACAPKVTAIEVAFDAYSAGATKDELAEQAVRFYRFCHPLVGPYEERKKRGYNHRVYREKNRDKVEEAPFFHVSSVVRRLLDGWQIGIGEEDGERYQHVYLKTTDKAGKVMLAESECRARIEIRLRDAALPYADLAEWAVADFAKDFRDTFTFRKLKVRINPYTRYALERFALQVGERKQRWRVHARKQSGDRLYLSSTRADSVLTEKARDAFRQLTMRWQR